MEEEGGERKRGRGRGMSTYQSDVGERDRNVIDVHYIVRKYVHPHEDLVELNSHTSNTCQISKSINRRGGEREREKGVEEEEDTKPYLPLRVQGSRCTLTLQTVFDFECVRQNRDNVSHLWNQNKDKGKWRRRRGVEEEGAGRDME